MNCPLAASNRSWLTWVRLTGDLGAPRAVGAAEDRFAEGQVPAVAGDQLDLVVFGLCRGLVQGGEQPGGLALVSEHAAEGAGRAPERRGGEERPVALDQHRPVAVGQAPVA